MRGHLLLTNCLEDELTRPNIELALKKAGCWCPAAAGGSTHG